MRGAPATTRARLPATVPLTVACTLLIAAAAMSIVSLGYDVPVTYGTQVGIATFSTALCSYPIVGWLIVRRDRANRIGWLFLFIGVLAGIHLSATMYGTLATSPLDLPLGVEAEWVGNWGWVGWIGVIATLVAPLFPDGRPVARWLWPVIGFVALGLVAGAAAEALAPGPIEVDPRFTNPFGIESPFVGALGAGLMAMPVGIAMGVVSLVVRYRRGDATVRLQLRWFILSLAAVGLGFVGVLFSPGGGIETWRGVEGLKVPLTPRIIQDVVTTGWSLVAIAVGVAVMRFRLYAVDVVINRALVYGSLTAILASVYLVAVVGLQAVLPFRAQGDVAVAISTLLVAALFGPLRRRLQAFIDRRFYRARYDAERLVDTFASRMRQQVDLGGITAELEASVRTAVHPASASVWLRPR